MKRAAAAAALVLLAACTGARRTPSPALSTTAPSPTPSAAADLLASCPRARAFDSLPVFARGLGAPDDLLSLSDGSVWVNDPTNGTLRHLSATGRVLQTIADPDAPEGMVALPDGRMIVAEQRLNRLVAIRPPSSARAVVLQLPPAGAALGVDGIAFDAPRARIIVPDSARGTVLAWPVSGGPPTELARGLGRVVGAAIGSDGEIFVAAEASAGLSRIPATGGRAEPLGRIVQADDAVFARGLLYVTQIASGRLLAVDPRTGADRVLVTGIRQAQGLAVIQTGRLAVVDSGRSEVALADAC